MCVVVSALSSFLLFFAACPVLERPHSFWPLHFQDKLLFSIPVTVKRVTYCAN
jgi:hypothetical protein